MKLSLTLLILATQGYFNSAAQVRGVRTSNGGIGGAHEKRALKEDMAMGGMESGSGSGGGNSGEDRDGLREDKPCEPDPARAIEFVQYYGMPEEGDMDCFTEPVNSCGGGCCRFGVYFICDGSNEYYHLPCVCNANTADPNPPPVLVESGFEDTMGNSTNSTNSTMRFLMNIDEEEDGDVTMESDESDIHA